MKKCDNCLEYHHGECETCKTEKPELPVGTRVNNLPTNKEILEVAFDRGANYKPWAEDLDPQWYYIKGFEDGAKWLLKKLK